MMDKSSLKDDGQHALLSKSEPEADEEQRIFPKHITIYFHKDTVDKLAFLRETLIQRQFDPTKERALVFVFRRKDAEAYAAAFGDRADFYHAGRDSDEKLEIARRFRNGDISVLFATKAFGMGVDIPNIRSVFHMTPPSSLEDYIQEIGRAGRDGSNSSAHLPYTDNDFSDVRSRLIKTQLNWEMVRAMHYQLTAYRDTLAPGERTSFIVPHDLIAMNPALNANLFGKSAAATRQRMLLHSLEEAERLDVVGFEMTHWPVALGERESADEDAHEIRNMAKQRGATQEKIVFLSEHELRKQLNLENDTQAREQLFHASRLGAIRIPMEVAVEWTRWAQDETNHLEVDEVNRLGDNFMRRIASMDGSSLVIAHENIHPPYLADTVQYKKRRDMQPALVHFDESAARLLRFLRRVNGIRVSGNRRSASYQIQERDLTGKRGHEPDWRDVVKQLATRATSVIRYLRSANRVCTFDVLYNVAAAGLEEMRLADLELVLHYLAALGIVRLNSDLSPTSVRIETREEFDDSFNTDRDEKAREWLNERNKLRLLRLDALQVLTRIHAKQDQEEFVKAFFVAGSIADARRTVIAKAGEVDPLLQKQFDAAALDAFYNGLTAGQKCVVRVSQTKTLVVKAGPGTGKTHTLINCIGQRLIASEKIVDGRNPNGPISAHDILVLAYTRAVVEELRHRIRKLLGDLGRNEIPLIHTFHSYALIKLREKGRRDVPMQEAIGEFVKSFQGGGLSNPPTHVFVDEFQDITDERAKMLKAITRSGTGILLTVIGDPDQSIYDYDKGEKTKISSEGYFRSFARHFAADELSLSVNFRSGKAIIDEAVTIFPNNLTASQDEEVGAVIRYTVDEHPLSDLVKMSIEPHRQVAVLFRTNYELYNALYDLKALKEQMPKVAVRVLGGTGRMVLSREINEALETLRQDYADEECREQLVEDISRQVWPRGNVWEGRYFRHLIDGAGLFVQQNPGKTVNEFIEWVESDLYGNQLVYASRQKRLETGGKELVLATMHRTKGLEFDAVVIAPSDMPLRPMDIEEEKRLRYVAVTRARRLLLLSEGPREKALGNSKAWEAPQQMRLKPFDSIDDRGNGAFKLYQLSEAHEYIKNCIKEGDSLRIKENNLLHNDYKLCGITDARQIKFHNQPLVGLYVSEVIRFDDFGENDKYKKRCSKEAQDRGWYYIVNVSGYLRPEQASR